MNTLKKAVASIWIVVGGLCWSRSYAQKKAPDCNYWIDFYSVANHSGYKVLQRKDLSADLLSQIDDPRLGGPMRFPGCVEADFEGNGRPDFALLILKEMGTSKVIKGRIAVKVKLIVMKGQINGSFDRLDLYETDDIRPVSLFINYLSRSDLNITTNAV